MQDGKMGLGGSGARHDNQKKSTQGCKKAKVANVTARPSGMKKHERSDALRGIGGASPVKAAGK
jgi:hypothetical protein